MPPGTRDMSVQSLIQSRLWLNIPAHISSADCPCMRKPSPWPDPLQRAGVLAMFRPLIHYPHSQCLSLPLGGVMLPFTDEGRALSEQHEGAGAEEDCDALCPDAHEGDQPAWP